MLFWTSCVERFAAGTSRTGFRNSRVGRIGCLTSPWSATRGGHTSCVKSPNDEDRKDGGRRSASNNAAREQQRRRRRSRQRRRGQGLQGWGRGREEVLREPHGGEKFPHRPHGVWGACRWDSKILPLFFFYFIVQQISCCRYDRVLPVHNTTCYSSLPPALSLSLSFRLIVVCNVSSSLIHPLDRDSIRTSPLSACVCLQEKGSLAGGSYATTGKTSARSDLSPVFGESYLLYLTFLLSTLRNYDDHLPLSLWLSRASIR